MRGAIAEFSVLVDLNDAILAAGGSEWKDWRKFNLDTIDPSEADALRARAAGRPREEFGAIGLAVMKDPRMCRLMPFWSPVFERGPMVGPGASADQARRSKSAGRSIVATASVPPTAACSGCAMSSTPKLETRGMVRAVLDWREFLRDSRKALAQANEQLGVIWPYWGEGALADIDTIRFSRSATPEGQATTIWGASRRHRSGSPDLWAMMDLVRDPGDRAVLRTLDELRAGFETASALFDLPMREKHDEAKAVRSQAVAEIARAADARDRGGSAARHPEEPAPAFSGGCAHPRPRRV